MRWYMKSKSPMILFGTAFISGLLVFVWMKNWGTCSHANKTTSRFTRSSSGSGKVDKAASAKTWKKNGGHETTYIKLEGVDSSEHDMFVVYGGTTEQLKAICSSMEDCEGFNSEGWVKSRVDSKKRASIDLYVKQGVTGKQMTGLRITDMDAGVYSKHIKDYDEMEQDMRVYIYDTPIGQGMPSYRDYKYGVEHLFISLLAKSKFRTKSPQEATFFLLPSRCSAYRKSVITLTEGVDKAAHTMKQMLEDIKHRYPYWNETLGMDHFYICAHDMGTELVKTSDPNLWKNSIGMVNTADNSEPMFVPHKDISLPPHPGRGTVDWAMIGQGGTTFDHKLRRKLAFMAGHPGRGPVRPKIYDYFERDQDFHLVKGYISDEDYMVALKTTKFCLCPRGNKAWSPRLMDALWFGCVPVIIADHYILPLSQIIDWETIAVIVDESQVVNLKKILLSISEETVTQMQNEIQSVYKHLTWNDPPRPYDAFHSILFQLWQKRYIRRKHIIL